MDNTQGNKVNLSVQGGAPQGQPAPATEVLGAPVVNEVMQPTQEISSPIKPVQLDDSSDTGIFEPITGKAEEKTVDFDAIMDEQMANIDSGKTEMVNTDKMPISVPLSGSDALVAFQQREIIKNLNCITDVMRDMTSTIQSCNSAKETYTKNFNLLMDGLKRIVERLDNDKIDPKEHLKKVLTQRTGSISDGLANPFNKYRDKDNITLEGNTAVSVMTALTGGMRRVVLWNSGFYITLRRLPLDELNSFYQEMNHGDYEYGKEFGLFYYLFADHAIVKFIIENLLPRAICGSNYAHWNDAQKLRQQISAQDFPVILAAMGQMLHPRGANANFICAEEGCGHVHSETIDLSKLRLNNEDLINEEMREHFAKKTHVNDTDLEEYRNKAKLNKEIEFKVGKDDYEQLWQLKLKQASVFDMQMVGADYLKELAKKCDLSNETEVYNNIIYNQFRCFRPWIESVSLTQKNAEGVPKTFTIENNGTPEMDQVIFTILDDFQQNVPTFADAMKQYILDTKITHICFYFPECPKCHTEPKNSYHGYIPYDPMHAFFTLALMKLLQGASK